MQSVASVYFGYNQALRNEVEAKLLSKVCEQAPGKQQRTQSCSRNNIYVFNIYYFIILRYARGGRSPWN